MGILSSLRLLERRESQWLAQFGLLLLIAFDALTHAPRQNPTIPRAALEPGLLPLHQLKPEPQHGFSRATLTPDADMKLRYAFSSKPLNDYLCSRLGLFSNCNLLDGIPISDILNRAIIIPTLEAVQEVKVQTNTYDAEIGRTGGGVIGGLHDHGGFPRRNTQNPDGSRGRRSLRSSRTAPWWPGRRQRSELGML